MTARKMRLGMSIRGYGYHPAAWRHPEVPADGTLRVEHYVRNTQVAESGKLDMIFFADGAGIRQGDIPHGSLSLTGRDMRAPTYGNRSYAASIDDVDVVAQRDDALPGYLKNCVTSPLCYECTNVLNNARANAKAGTLCSRG